MPVTLGGQVPVVKVRLPYISQKGFS